MATVLGIDIGGTGIKAACVDLERGTLTTDRARALTPQPAVPKAVARTILGLVKDIPLDDGAVVGAGFPAVIKDGRAETAANVDSSWIGADVEELISTAIGHPTAVVNDADAAGLAEVRFGAGRDVSGVVVMVTLGTGIGTGLFVNGQLIPNSELGHLEVRGKDGERRAAASVRERSHLSWKTWAKRVQEYLRELDEVLWPDHIIIGGGVSKEWAKFGPYIKVRPTIVPATLGNDAGIIGAALFAQERASAGGPVPKPLKRELSADDKKAG